MEELTVVYHLRLPAAAIPKLREKLEEFTRWEHGRYALLSEPEYRQYVADGLLRAPYRDEYPPFVLICSQEVARTIGAHLRILDMAEGYQAGWQAHAR